MQECTIFDSKHFEIFAFFLQNIASLSTTKSVLYIYRGAGQVWPLWKCLGRPREEEEEEEAAPHYLHLLPVGGAGEGI